LGLDYEVTLAFSSSICIKYDLYIIGYILL
jgi:hypothetical protein